MADKANLNAYEVKGITSSIKFTSRASVCITSRGGEKNFYTVEACEERLIPAVEGVDVAKEKQALWDAVNKECDDQIADILKVYKK